MLKRILAVTLSAAMIGAVLTGCSNDKEPGTESKMKLTFQGELRYFLDQVFVTDPGTTGIENVELNSKPAVTGVYSIDGRYLGNDVSKLGKGLYIVNGKKIVK